LTNHFADHYGDFLIGNRFCRSNNFVKRGVFSGAKFGQNTKLAIVKKFSLTNWPSGGAPCDSTCTYKNKGSLSAPLGNRTQFIMRRLTKLVGGRISALPTRPVLNTVQFTSLPKPQGSYDCTLPLLPDTFPLEDTRIFSHSLKTSRRQS